MARMIQVKDGMTIRKFLIDPPSITIGRSKKNSICLQDAVVSGFHAEIIVEENEKKQGVYFIQDLNSTNGLYINKCKVSCKQLKHKDTIRLGNNTFIFISEDRDVG